MVDILYPMITQKQLFAKLLKPVDTVRNIGGVTYSVSVYDPEIVAKTTVKETTLVANHHMVS